MNEIPDIPGSNELLKLQSYHLSFSPPLSQCMWHHQGGQRVFWPTHTLLQSWTPSFSRVPLVSFPYPMSTEVRSSPCHWGRGRDRSAVTPGRQLVRDRLLLHMMVGSLSNILLLVGAKERLGHCKTHQLNFLWIQILSTNVLTIFTGIILSSVCANILVLLVVSVY